MKLVAAKLQAIPKILGGLTNPAPPPPPSNAGHSNSHNAESSKHLARLETGTHRASIRSRPTSPMVEMMATGPNSFVGSCCGLKISLAASLLAAALCFLFIYRELLNDKPRYDGFISIENVVGFLISLCVVLAQFTNADKLYLPFLIIFVSILQANQSKYIWL